MESEANVMPTVAIPERERLDRPGRKAPRRLFLHDVAITMGAEATAMASSLLLTAILSRWMGARPLSEYLLLRRVLSWALGVMLLGMATGLPRYVAHSAGNGSKNESPYFLAALLCMIPANLGVAAVVYPYRATFARWLFGDAQEAGLVMALVLLLIGYAIHRAVYGYYRGLLEMARANLLEVLNAAILPLVVVLAMARTYSVAAMMGTTGVLMSAVAALFAIPVLLRLRGAPSLHLGRRCRELIQYGVPRVPGEFGAAALTALGPMLAVHFIKIARVTPLLLGLNMLMVIGYAAGPLGVVLLSKVSMMLGQNQHDAVQARLRLLVAGVMELSVFTCIQLAIFADVVVRAWVGPGFLDEMGVIRVVLLAIPFYLFFAALRSTIDAATVKPYNTANVMTSLAVYVALIFAWIKLLPGQSLLGGIAGALLVSQILLALLTARTFRRAYGVGVPWRKLGPSFAAALVLGGVALLFRWWQHGSVPVPEAVLAEAALAAIYLAVLARLGSGWLSYAWNVGICRRAEWTVPAAETGGAK
jgi:O-antigen/teichoic acid export membrane protein